MSPLGEESTLRKVSGGSEGYGSEEGLQVVESLGGLSGSPNFFCVIFATICLHYNIQKC